jgi:hypothetical protein
VRFLGRQLKADDIVQLDIQATTQQPYGKQKNCAHPPNDRYTSREYNGDGTYTALDVCRGCDFPLSSWIEPAPVDG